MRNYPRKRLKEDYMDEYAYSHAHLLSEHRVDMRYKLMNYLLDLTSYGEYSYDKFWVTFMRELYPKLRDCIEGFDKPEFDDEGVTFYNVIAEEVPTIDWACDVWFRQMYNKLKERFD